MEAVEKNVTFVGRARDQVRGRALTASNLPSGCTFCVLTTLCWTELCIAA